MAYPFIQFPTFAEFIARLSDERGIMLKDLEAQVSREDTPLSIHFLEGIVDGATVRCVVDIQDYDARISPSLHRSICARFKLDPESLGSNKVAADDGAVADPEI